MPAPVPPKASFNSTMVRLKELADAIGISPTASFNSTMVRLKAIQLAEVELILAKFQFHNGSIKSPSPLIIHRVDK